MKRHPPPAGSQAPPAVRPGQWLSADHAADVFTLSVGHRWGGQKKVFQIYDHYSHRNFPYLIREETECPRKLRNVLRAVTPSNLSSTSTTPR